MSKYIDELSQKMDLKTWPHQFSKTGKTFQIGVNEYKEPIFAVEMTCIHCGAKYVNGQTQRPADPCPARNKNREIKRILG